MFLIAGLGNPGQKYTETRHNAGFWFIDELARLSACELRPVSKLHVELVKTTIAGHQCLLIKPDTFMNRSGLAVRSVMDYYRIGLDRLLVAYDELDLPPGTARLKQGGGHGGHNGMRDLFAHLGDRDFLRLRLGIGHPGQKHLVSNYVLSRAAKDEEKLIRESIADAATVITDVLDGDLEKAMCRLHTK